MRERERMRGRRKFKLMYCCSCYNLLFKNSVSGLNLKKGHIVCLVHYPIKIHSFIHSSSASFFSSLHFSLFRFVSLQYVTLLSFCFITPLFFLFVLFYFILFIVLLLFQCRAQLSSSNSTKPKTQKSVKPQLPPANQLINH